MDTSKKYIEMCKKATKLQEEWSLDVMDYLYYPDVDEVIVWTACGDNNPPMPDKPIWLPQQDRLQKILLSKMDLGHLIVGMGTFYDPEAVCGHGAPCRKCREMGEHRRKTYGTMEQWWLAFVMYEKFDKEWNGVDWVEM